MSDLPALLGSGATFTIDGTVYRWSPLTLGDEADMEQEIRAMVADRLDVIGMVLRTLPKEAAGDDRKVLLDRAFHEHCRLARMGASELAAEFQLPDVDAVVFRYHLRAHHPDLSVEDVKRIICTPGCPAIAAMLSEQARSVLPGESSRPSCDSGSAWSPRRIASRAKAALASAGS